MFFKQKIKTNKISREKIEEVLIRRIEAVFPSKDEVINKLNSGPGLRIYLGIDPTGPDLHLGHTVPILFLKQLLEIGHKPVLLIGDFTARIGDPTGKDSSRKSLTKKEVRDNMKNYIKQVYRILPKGSFEIKYNSSWLSKMLFEDVMKLSNCATVQQMLARDMFQERIKNEKPIGIHEFLYPLMQGYDSVAMKIDGEVGGNDQTFNMLIGRDLEKKIINKDKLVFATKLLVDTESGKKMSKTEGGLISLGDSPKDMFGKIMKFVPDEMIEVFFRLCTEKPLEWISEKKITDNPYRFKKELASEIVKIYHSEADAKKTTKEWEKVFAQKDLPDEIKEWSIQNGLESLVDVLIGSSLANSKAEAKRLIDQNAVKINEQVVNNWRHVLKEGDVLKVGSRKFLKLK